MLQSVPIEVLFQFVELDVLCHHENKYDHNNLSFDDNAKIFHFFTF